MQDAGCDHRQRRNVRHGTNKICEFILFHAPTIILYFYLLMVSPDACIRFPKIQLAERHSLSHTSLDSSIHEF